MPSNAIRQIQYAQDAGRPLPCSLLPLLLFYELYLLSTFDNSGRARRHISPDSVSSCRRGLKQERSSCPEFACTCSAAAIPSINRVHLDLRLPSVQRSDDCAEDGQGLAECCCGKVTVPKFSVSTAAREASARAAAAPPSASTAAGTARAAAAVLLRPTPHHDVKGGSKWRQMQARCGGPAWSKWWTSSGAGFGVYESAQSAALTRLSKVAGAPWQPIGNMSKHEPSTEGLLLSKNSVFS